MPVIRPELSAWGKRWSEVLAGLAIALFGVWALQANDRFFQFLAGLVIMVGLTTAVIGWRRLRFQRPGIAPGIVQLVEGQISYFGPDNGGFMPLRDIVELHLVADGTHWLLISDQDGSLEIPVAASGAEVLFDAFAHLPGLRMQSVLTALNDPEPAQRQALWLHPSRQARFLQMR
ncbi:MAG: hypothetical protein ACXIUW_07890 [Roseinatronobacter sp.]